MNERQRYALEHPLNAARGRAEVERLRSIQHVGGGELLVVILAVDR